jgi:hypothetical protein
MKDGLDLLCAALIMLVCTPMGWIGMAVFFVGLHWALH